MELGSPVRKTAVPGTRGGGFLSRLREQVEERDFQASGLVEQDAGAAAPGQHHQHQEDAERHRDPAALDEFQEVGGEEGGVDEQERRDQGDGGRQTPVPDAVDDDEGEQSRHHHRSGNRNAIGTGERARRAEHGHQQEHREQKQEIDARHEDLPGARRGGVADLEPRQAARAGWLAGSSNRCR